MIPGFKTSIKWVASRLAIDLPDLDDVRLKAIQEQVVTARATTLKEAIPIPIFTVGALEKMVCNVHEHTQGSSCGGSSAWCLPRSGSMMPSTFGHLN